MTNLKTGSEQIGFMGDVKGTVTVLQRTSFFGRFTQWLKSSFNAVGK